MYFIIANPAAQSGQQDNHLLQKLESALKARQQPYFTCFTPGRLMSRNSLRAWTGGLARSS